MFRHAKKSVLRVESRLLPMHVPDWEIDEETLQVEDSLMDCK